MFTKVQQFLCWLSTGHDDIPEVEDAPGGQRLKFLRCYSCGRKTAGWIVLSALLALSLSACSNPAAPTCHHDVYFYDCAAQKAQPIRALEPHNVTAYEVESWFWSVFGRPPSPGELAEHEGQSIADFMAWLSAQHTATLLAVPKSMQPIERFALPTFTHEYRAENP